LNLFIYSEDIITSHNPYLPANIIYKRNEELRVKYLVKAADYAYYSKGLLFSVMTWDLVKHCSVYPWFGEWMFWTPNPLNLCWLYGYAYKNGLIYEMVLLLLLVSQNL